MICVSDQKSAQNTFTFYYLAAEISLSIALSMINERWAPSGGDDDQGIQGTELDGVTLVEGLGQKKSGWILEKLDEGWLINFLI